MASRQTNLRRKRRRKARLRKQVPRASSRHQMGIDLTKLTNWKGNTRRRQSERVESSRPATDLAPLVEIVYQGHRLMPTRTVPRGFGWRRFDLTEDGVAIFKNNHRQPPFEAVVE